MILNSYAKGLWAEIYAMIFLWVKGYRILAWRYKTPVGEIDIITKHHNDIICVEVKARHTTDRGIESVSHVSQNRITRAAKHFLSSRRTHYKNLRFDVIAVAGIKISHLKNAWGEEMF